MRPIYFFKKVVFKAITPFRFILWGLILTVFIPVNSNAQQHPWVKHENNPIIAGTPEGWDDDIWYPAVIYDESDSLYKMWYAGFFGGCRQIGYAWSADGINWTLEEDPVIPGTSGDWDYFKFPGTVLLMNGLYKMW